MAYIQIVVGVDGKYAKLTRWSAIPTGYTRCMIAAVAYMRMKKNPSMRIETALCLQLVFASPHLPML